MSSRKSSHAYHPRNWPIVLVIALGRCLARLPYGVLLRLGQKLGRLAYRVDKRTRLITRKNIQACFPTLPPAAQQELVLKSFESSGMGMMETLMSWWKPNHTLTPQLDIHGLEEVTRAHQAGKGVILLCAHLASLEIIGTLLARHYSFAVMYNRFKHPLLEKINHQHLTKTYTKAIAREQLREFLRCLKNNEMIFYTPDIDAAIHTGVFAPFFGVAAYTLTTTAKIVAKTGAKIIPCAFYRRDDLQGYEVWLHPALNDFPSNDELADATHINQVLETLIKPHPEQYFWQYKRFKTRPQGEPDFYHDANV
ncbi:MAG: hypothetical protein KIT27_06345 [Legionellales bacterium]|nr:hypothetical protein [Legionellales bacterium]